jgi:hypothetical protein
MSLASQVAAHGGQAVVTGRRRKEFSRFSVGALIERMRHALHRVIGLNYQLTKHLAEVQSPATPFTNGVHGDLQHSINSMKAGQQA